LFTKIYVTTEAVESKLVIFKERKGFGGRVSVRKFLHFYSAAMLIISRQLSITTLYVCRVYMTSG